VRPLLFVITVAAWQAVHAQAPAGPHVVDRVVATAGDRVITASDVALEQILSVRDPSPVPEIQARRDDPLVALVDLALARSEAGDISVYAPSGAEVRERLEAIRASWVDPRDWKRFLSQVGYSEQQLAGALYSRMVAERYIQRNITGPARSRVDDLAAGNAAATAAYERWASEQRRRTRVREVPPIFGAGP